MNFDELEQRVRNLIQESKDGNFTRYLLQMQQRIKSQRHQFNMLQEELEGNYRLYQSNMQAMQQGLPQVPAAQTQQTMPAYYYQAVPEPPGRKQKNAEFAIGAAILSIVGGTFILIALIFAGVYFMDSFAQGMGIYGICFLAIAFAELFLYPRLRKLGMTISAVGMGGLYIATLVNHLVMNNFDMWIALGVIFLITTGVLLLSWKRNAVSYRVLGMAAAFICMTAICLGVEKLHNGLWGRDVLAVAGIMLLVNLVCLVVPVHKSRAASDIMQLLFSTFFALVIAFLGTDVQGGTETGKLWEYPVFIAVSVLVAQLIFIRQIRWKVKQKPDGTIWDNFGICMAYGISALLHMCMTVFVMKFVDWDFTVSGLDGNSCYRVICVCACTVLAIIPFLFLRRRQEKWLSWYQLYMMVLALYISTADDWRIAGCTGMLMVVLKLLSFLKIPVLRPGDAILTVYACVCVLLEYKESYMIPLFAVLVFSVLCINYWKVYFETTLTLTIAVYTALHMLPMLKLPVFAGILFVGMLLFNNVRRWRGEDILVYNCIMLGGQGICYLFLINPVYQNAFLTYLCMLIFGVSTIVVCFQENYHMAFRVKYMVLAMFLTYMALVIHTSYTVINSIAMMLIALFSVGLGFIHRTKPVRIYGLVLSLVVCGKIVLYDYPGTSVKQKMILFFVVGVLALVIAAIYMILEKSAGKKLVKDPASVQPAGQSVQ